MNAAEEHRANANRLDAEARDLRRMAYEKENEGTSLRSQAEEAAANQETERASQLRWQAEQAQGQAHYSSEEARKKEYEAEQERQQARELEQDNSRGR